MIVEYSYFIVILRFKVSIFREFIDLQPITMLIESRVLIISLFLLISKITNLPYYFLAKFYLIIGYFNLI